MKHYEIVLIINPEKSKTVSTIIKEYKNVILSKKGKIHRLEDWGRRTLVYLIKNFRKASYILMNIETSIEVIKNLENSFKFNENILRYLILSMKCAVTEISPILKNKEENNTDNGLKNISKRLT